MGHSGVMVGPGTGAVMACIILIVAAVGQTAGIVGDGSGNRGGNGFRRT